MAFACIDIGSNTTRLLVAEAAGTHFKEVLQQRAFTRIAKGRARGEPIGAAKIAEVADVVAMQVRVAQELEARSVRTVATAAIRQAPNAEELVDAIRSRAGVDVTVLSGEDEARLAFAGATKTLGHEPEGEVAVVDVGGGSSELALGTMTGGVSWSESFRVGSGFLADAYVRSDPPAPAELNRVRAHVAGVFEGLELPTPRLAVAVGGSAASLRRLVGAVLEYETLERGIRVLASTRAEELARRFELEPERVRLLPAGILILEAVSDCLRSPLQVGRGGLREGVVLEMIAAAGGG